ncbi:MAG: GNAT family N-acetyltransferase [Deltaproteobacteria bacterium]|nr:GNAT family N-acetyltransferase [Deltaproteobacteria bacterium]
MPTFDIIKKSNPKTSFRIQKIKDMFDLKENQIIERFKGEIKIPVKWSIGVIVGNSGTGKTTIAKELFKKAYITNFIYKAQAVIDDMPDVDISLITKTFNSVGFSSVPSWLKPYNVLSNGEKMRVDIARSILEKNKLIVFDEFTSVVDRNIAKISSFAIQKAIRKTEKQFIAVGCHYDIIDWLLPDWIFDTNTMTFQLFEGQKKNRPEIKSEIRCIKDVSEKEKVWRELGKYHYLSHSYNKASTPYVLYINNELAGMIMILHFPHPKFKNGKQGHRTTIKPDFQGIGLGNFMIDYVAKYLIKKGFRYFATTSSPAIIAYRKKRKEWKCTRIGRVPKYGKTGAFKKSKASSINRITTSWEYIAKKK